MQTSNLSPDSLSRVERHLKSVGFAAVLHWHCSGARHPTPLAFYDFESFVDYLRENGKPGDAIDVWPFPDKLNERIIGGKIPNADGSVQEGGAY